MTAIDFNYGKGFTFSKHIEKDVSDFDRVFGVFKELLTHTSGDIEEAFEWLKTLDAEYNIFNENYSLEDFEDDLKKRGYIKEEIDPDKVKSVNGTGKGKNRLTAKLESALRDYALNQIFGKLKKSGLGNHNTKKIGVGDERDGENRSFQFGDDLSTVNMTESLKNAQINNGISDLRLTENDLIVEETKHKAQMSGKECPSFKDVIKSKLNTSQPANHLPASQPPASQPTTCQPANRLPARQPPASQPPASHQPHWRKDGDTQPVPPTSLEEGW